MGKIKQHLFVLVALLCMAVFVPYAGAADALKVYRVGGPELAATDVLVGKYRAQEIQSTLQALTPMPENRGWWRLEYSDKVETIERPVLYLEAMSLTSAQVWLPDAHTAILLSHTNNYAQNGYSPRLLVVELRSPIKAGQSVYLRVLTREYSSMPVGIASERNLRHKDAQQSRYFSLIEGSLIALVFAGLLLSITMREWPFLLLTLGTFLSLLFIIADNGNIYHYALFTYWDSEVPLQRIFGMAAFAVMAYFSYGFLDMARNTPRVAWIQRLLILTMLILLVANFIPAVQHNTLIPTLGNLSLIIAAATWIVASTVLILNGNKRGIFYLLSWLPLVVLSLWRIIEVTFKLPFNEWVSIAFPASYMLAGVLLYIGLGERVLNYKRQRDANHMLARVDSLTDVYNRRALDERLQIAASQNAKSGQAMALLFADLDHFKAINDTYGHSVGDAVLKQVTLRIRDALRFGDVLGRYGGEEFVIALPNSDAEHALAIAERIRQNVAEHAVVFENHSIPVTVSIGVAIVINDSEAIDSALKRADAALYECKQTGRNRVLLATQ